MQRGLSNPEDLEDKLKAVVAYLGAKGRASLGAWLKRANGLLKAMERRLSYPGSKGEAKAAPSKAQKLLQLPGEISQS